MLNEVADRAASVGSLGKVEIGALVVWKRLRANTPWVMSLMGKPDAEVREITAAARTAALDPSLSVVEAAGQARNALKSLPGCRGGGNAVASAMLTALAPDRMAVYDRRAYSALSLLFDGNVPRSYSYADYMKTVDDLRQQVGRGWGTATWTSRSSPWGSDRTRPNRGGSLGASTAGSSRNEVSVGLRWRSSVLCPEANRPR